MPRLSSPSDTPPTVCIPLLHLLFLFLPVSFCPVLERRGVDSRASGIYCTFLLCSGLDFSLWTQLCPNIRAEVLGENVKGQSTSSGGFGSCFLAGFSHHSGPCFPLPLGSSANRPVPSNSRFMAGKRKPRCRESCPSPSPSLCVSTCTVT